ncbi:MAG TPA: 3-hydroxyacyl-ACP dehydratase FabZ [Candidatus Gallacutalibacter stercoravium]|nr:3-hydroxyacyl-ACP dehydratase FabZ [Candidatus Gallacutalibacter stercoravium]
MNKEELMQILPHRDPMMLVDEAELVDENTARGKKTIKGDEWFLQGHFPDHPVVPGVILCEIMAQSSAVIVADRVKGAWTLFTSINNARFKHPVFPGDTIEVECRLVKSRGNFFFVEGEGKVNGQLAVKAEFSFALLDKQAKQ